MEAAQRVRTEPPQPPREGPTRVGPGPVPERAGDGARDQVHARGPREGGDEATAVRGGELAADVRAVGGAQLVRDRGDVRHQPGVGGAAVGHEVTDDAAQLGDAVARHRRGREHPCTAQTVLVDPLGEVGQDGRAFGLREQIGLVQDHHRHVRVPRHRPEVLLVDHRVGVLLRVQHPDEDVHGLSEPGGAPVVADDDGVDVGEVEQDEPTQVAAAPAGLHLVALVHLEPVQERGSVCGGAPHHGQRVRRGGAPHPDPCRGGATQGVEQKGLAASGCAGEGDDRVLGGELAALPDMLEHRVGVPQRSVRPEPLDADAVQCCDRLTQAGQAGTEVHGAALRARPHAVCSGVTVSGCRGPGPMAARWCGSVEMVADTCVTGPVPPGPGGSARAHPGPAVAGGQRGPPPRRRGRGGP